jgi:hypothetical protein
MTTTRIDASKPLRFIGSPPMVAATTDPLHARVRGCYLDIGKPIDCSHWVLEIDFIHSTHQPDALGMALIHQACYYSEGRGGTSKRNDLSSSCYTSVHFKSRRRAIHASRWVAALIEHFYGHGIGLVARGQRDPYGQLLFELQPPA